MLLLRRSLQGSYAGATVFPGGHLEPGESLEMCAVRECFEETGILLTRQRVPAPIVENARRNLKRHRDWFAGFLKTHGLVPAQLTPFSTWITPKGMPRRFETHFYMHFLEFEAVASPDREGEAISCEFMRPAEALSLFRERKIVLFPPQYYLLSRLDQYLATTPSKAAFLDFARDFGSRTVSPAMLGVRDGLTVLELRRSPTNESEGVFERLLVKFGPSGPETIDEESRSRL